MQGTIQRIQAERSFGFIQDPEGGNVFFHRSALTYPDSFATLEVGMGVELELESSPKGPRAARIAVTSLETHPTLSFEELAAYFQRHAAGYIHERYVNSNIRGCRNVCTGEEMSRGNGMWKSGAVTRQGKEEQAC